MKRAANTKPAAPHFDADGHPSGTGWDEVLFPDLGDAAAYALEVDGDTLLPVFRAGQRLTVPAADVVLVHRIVWASQ